MHKKVEIIMRKILHVLEFIIAILTLIVLIGMLGLEIYKMFTVSDYFSSMDQFLHNVLTIVVGLEFVRMLIDMTPANTIEVLIMATARQIIVSHGDAWTLLISIVCVGILFAIRRFLIPRSELTLDLVEIE